MYIHMKIEGKSFVTNWAKETVRKLLVYRSPWYSYIRIMVMIFRDINYGLLTKFINHDYESIVGVKLR
jgi:hypothetical protein